jgi:hypothetical protein
VLADVLPGRVSGATRLVEAVAHGHPVPPSATTEPGNASSRLDQMPSEVTADRHRVFLGR